jgi:hypothetical protein
VLPLDDEALQSDVYLELLLDSHRRAPTMAVPPPTDPADAETRSAAQLLDRTLVRFHPSFRFEEGLAGRLRSAAEALSSPTPSGGQTIAFPLRPGVIARLPLATDERDALNRVLVGGAIASGVSIAGAAAWLAWRRRSRQETVA